MFATACGLYSVQLYPRPAWTQSHSCSGTWDGRATWARPAPNIDSSFPTQSNIVSQTLSTHCSTGNQTLAAQSNMLAACGTIWHPTSWPQSTAMQALALMKRGPKVTYCVQIVVPSQAEGDPNITLGPTHLSSHQNIQPVLVVVNSARGTTVSCCLGTA